MVRIVVLVSAVLHPVIPVEITGEKGLVQKEPAAIYIMNPSDRCALEEAMRLREQNNGVKVTAVGAGSSNAENCLRYCLGRGVDQAVLVPEPVLDDDYARAIVTSRAAQKLGFDLILCGNDNLDSGFSPVGPYVAELLGLPQVTRVVRIEMGDTGVVKVERKLERGNRERLACPLPAVLAVDPAIDQPQYVSVHSQLLALNGKIQRIGLESLGLDAPELIAKGQLTEVIEVKPPRPRPKKTFVPESTLSAEERLKLLLSGPPKQGKGSRFLEGTPNQIADQIVRYLEQEKLLED